MADTPFDTIESALEYVTLLGRQLEDVGTDVTQEIGTAALEGAMRRVDALRLIDYKLRQLATHLAASRRILNDLRMLRRVVTAEGHDRSVVAGEVPEASEPERGAFA